MAENEKGKGRRGPKGDRERFQLVIPKSALDDVKKLADKENRSISNMLATLVTEAINSRKEDGRGPMSAALT